MSFKPIDTTKEDFRNYLTKSGVLESLTKVLMRCHDNRPVDPLVFIQENISESLKNQIIIKDLQEKLQAANEKIALLEQEKLKLFYERSDSDDKLNEN